MTDPDPDKDPADIPPHLAEPPMAEMVPRPIEVSPIHFRAHGRCYAAFVVDVISEDPMSPEFLVDAVVFAPRDRARKDRFSNASKLPGSVRWANNLHYALPAADGTWQDTTWHYPGRQCLPEVVLRGADA
ncbi:hypothetical protein [Longimicrobium sp.]|jgi:hypothetical protein|uniref:hypothetical protein n=1 Tax=Longimicrobium sp. TaxID=2029185 RepID=UPI002EDAAC23